MVANDNREINADADLIQNNQQNVETEETMPQLEEFLHKRIRAVKVEPNKYKLSFPMYKIDGGMYIVYFISAGNGMFYLSDEGSTVEELDRIFELSEPDVIKNLVAILKQYNCSKRGKSITIDCTPKDIHIKLSYLIQAISFMLNMKIFYV